MEYSQRHLKVWGELFDSYTNAQLATFTQSTYSSLTQVKGGRTIRHSCTQVGIYHIIVMRSYRTIWMQDSGRDLWSQDHALIPSM